MNEQHKSIEILSQTNGQFATQSKLPITNREELSTAYTPGIAQVSLAIADDHQKSWELTSRNNMVAVISDGSAVLGLGNIGPLAAMPVMEGKASLFKTFADIDAIPMVLNTQDTNQIIEVIEAVAPTFGGINLEDIAAPGCFIIEQALKERLDIPVFHDDQHGTAIVVLAALQNALTVVEKDKATVRIVINGFGAAGMAIARLLIAEGYAHVVACDSRGIITLNRDDLNEVKHSMAQEMQWQYDRGSLEDAMRNTDVFIGVSVGDVVSEDMVRSMNEGAIVFAMANPEPEIHPDLARQAGAAVIATGRSDFPNQVNNVLAFPGIFRGALEAGAKSITLEMKLAAVKALAEAVDHVDAEHIMPDVLDRDVTAAVALAVREAVGDENKR